MTDKALIVSDMDTMTLGKMLAQSGYFADARDAAQAVVKVLAGREMGLGPVASMTGVYIVKGRPALSANLLAGVLKRSGRYNYRVMHLDATRAEIVFFERNGAAWDEIGRSVFTADDARKAGTQNMERYARNMLFARAMTNGIRWYCPDVFAGGVYTPEELGAPVDEEGQVVEVENTVPASLPAPNGNGHDMTLEDAANLTTPKGARLGDMSADGLTLIIEHPKASATLKKAAGLLLDAMQEGARE